MPKVRKAKKTKKRRSSGRANAFTRFQNHLAARLRGVRYRAGAAARLATLGVSVIAAIGLLALWGAGWLGDAAREAGRVADRAFAEAGFTVRHIDVAGAEKTDAEAVRLALGELAGRSIFALDAEAAREAVEALGWVEAAVVARLLPDRVAVVIDERQPAAVWQREGAFFVLDRFGAVIEGADAAGYGALPVVVGSEAAGAAPELLSAYAQFPAVAERVEAAQRVGARRWTLWIDTGLKVHLPEEDSSAAMAILADLHARRHILDAPASLIDLRDSTRIVIRPREGHDSIELKGREA